MKKLVTSLAAATAFLLATATQASAYTTFWIMGAVGRGHSGRAVRHHGGGFGFGHGHSPGNKHGQGFEHAPSAPEIDVSQAAAAIVILLIAFLLIREIYLRQTEARPA